MRNQRGQTLIELVLVFPVVLLFATGLIGLIIIFGAVHSIHFIGEETLYCSLHSAPGSCKTQGQRALHAIPGIQVMDFRVGGNSNLRTVNLNWQLSSKISSILPRVGQNLRWQSDIEIFNEK